MLSASSFSVTGTALVTVTVTDCDALPPLPVQERLYVAVAEGVAFSLPLVDLFPLQPPLAVHDDVLVEDQVSVVDCPAVIDDGVAESETVGGVGGGGDPPLASSYAPMSH